MGMASGMTKRRNGARLIDVVIGRRYRLGARIGAGSMGVVHEAMDLETNRPVAVKIVHSHFADCPEVAERFRREVLAANAANSEYVLRVLDEGSDPTFGTYLVTERLFGEDLDARLQRSRRLDVHEAVAIAIQVARGLAPIHAAGVVHRDLKPANIFLTRDANGVQGVKVLDFGIARLRASEAWTTITNVGVAVGTPVYMSPEQAAALDDVDSRTDVWSVCAILFEMLAGRTPFLDEGSAAEVMLQIVTDRAPWIRNVAPWVPAELAAVIQDGLARSRSKRIPDCATLADRLSDALPEAMAPVSRVSTRI
jgi:serine/threonine-protein kinase